MGTNKENLMIKILTVLSAIVIGFGLLGQTKKESHKEFDMDKVEKSDQEWETCLTPEEYQILRVMHLMFSVTLMIG